MQIYWWIYCFRVEHLRALLYTRAHFGCTQLYI